MLLYVPVPLAALHQVWERRVFYFVIIQVVNCALGWLIDTANVAHLLSSLAAICVPFASKGDCQPNWEGCREENLVITLFAKKFPWFLLLLTKTTGVCICFLIIIENQAGVLNI